MHNWHSCRNRSDEVGGIGVLFVRLAGRGLQRLEVQPSLGAAQLTSVKCAYTLGVLSHALFRKITRPVVALVKCAPLPPASAVTFFAKY